MVGIKSGRYSSSSVVLSPLFSSNSKNGLTISDGSVERIFLLAGLKPYDFGTTFLTFVVHVACLEDSSFHRCSSHGLTIYLAHGLFNNVPPSVLMCNAPSDVVVTSTLLKIFVPSVKVLNQRRSTSPSFTQFIVISSSTILALDNLLILNQVLVQTLNMFRGLPCASRMTVYCHCPSYISQRTLISLSWSLFLTLFIKYLNSQLESDLPFSA